MTEAEWLAATDSKPMLEQLWGKVSDRKCRLLAVSCWRHVWLHLTDEDRRAVQVADEFAEGTASPKEMAAALNSRAEPYVGRTDDIVAGKACGMITYLRDAWWVARLSVESSVGVAMTVAEDVKKTCDAEELAQAELVRDVIGKPFRKVKINKKWLTSTVLALAHGIYADRAFDRLPILADALQDAGCDNPDVLGHCRGPGPHVRGCWVVDLLLGKG
jgi:hypothetical protein